MAIQQQTGVPLSKKEVPKGAETPDEILKYTATVWLDKISKAYKHKRSFNDDAWEARNFFDGEANWFWKDQYARSEHGYNRTMNPPGFRMQVNKVFEAVKLFGSVIYHRNPFRQVTPTTVPLVPPEALGINMQDPMAGQQYQQMVQVTSMKAGIREVVADLLQRVLNYTPREYDLKTHSRRVVDEGLITGCGVWWTELMTMPNGRQFVGSFADSIDNFLMDPDATEIEDILWCAKRCVHPVHEVAEKYNLDEAALRGNIDKQGAQNARSQEQVVFGDYDGTGKRTSGPTGKTNDLCVYWKIWSKTGLGDRLKDAPKDIKGVFDGVGENAYIVVAEGVDYPLNIKPAMLGEEVNEQGVPDSLFTAVQWPIPFWADGANGWPFTTFSPHRKPGYIWPISHIKPAIPELRFLCWAYSFMAQRVATSCETLLGVSKAADQDIKDQILSQSEAGFKIVEVSEMLGRSVNDIISVFQLPNVTGEIWQVIDAVTQLADKRLGMTELVYGMTDKQIRSATEASVKSDQISIRPDDMAEVLENSMTLLSRKEAIATRWLLKAEDLEPIIGPLGAAAWEQHVQQMNPYEIAREYDYTVEAGSARKKNKSARIEQMNQAVQILGPVLQGLIQAGITEPFNALMSDWADSMDIDASAYMVPAPPPPQPPEMVEGPPPEEAPAEEPPPEEPRELPPPDGQPTTAPQIPPELVG
jgi:hypothetical protein